MHSNVNILAQRISMLIALASCLNGCSCKSDIPTSMSVILTPKGHYWGDLVHIEETIDNIKGVDTLHLSLKNNTLFNYSVIDESGENFIVRNLSVSSNAVEEYTFDGVKLDIPINYHYRGESVDINVSYDYQGTTWIRLKDTAITGFLASCTLLYAPWNSWYFTAESIKPERIRVAKEEGSNLLTNSNIRDDSNNYEVLPCHKEGEEVVVLIVRERFFDSKELKIGETVVKRSFLKNFTAVSEGQLDFSKIDLPPMPRDVQQFRDSVICATISNLKDLLYSDVKRINIIDNYCHSDKVRFCFTFHSCGGEHSILADTLAYKNGSLAHEIAHCFLPEIVDCDKGVFLFSESLPEIVSLYAGDGEQLLEAIGRKKIIADSRTEWESIFDISTNNTGDDNHEGTSHIIYDVVPYKLYNFSENIGKELFFKIINRLEKRIERQGGIVRLQDFEDVAFEYGVKADIWEDFINSI